jgi:hypothetical protein
MAIFAEKSPFCIVWDMIPHFKDYCWCQGKPVGISKTSKETAQSFKIIGDAYHKRFSVERYEMGRFASVVYDSSLFDFRLLKKADEAGWQRETIEETGTHTLSLIRNMEERVILIEKAFFENNICRLCKIYSPQSIEIASQDICFRSRGDAFDGVMLKDILGRFILIKHYALDPETQEFGTLLDEIWDHRFSMNR